MSVDKGQTVAIIGPSGSGKSTLLRCINCLTRISGGEISLNGTTFVSPDAKTGGDGAVYLSEKELREISCETGMVFQHFNLFPHMTCLQNIIYAPIKVKKTAKEEAVKHGESMLSLVGLAEKRNEYLLELRRKRRAFGDQSRPRRNAQNPARQRYRSRDPRTGIGRRIG